jgi:hypothetical protein
VRRVVEEADERLQEAVVDAQPAIERVEEVVVAAAGRDADAERRLLGERAERVAGRLGVRGLAEVGRAAGERLHRRGLRHAADPRRLADAVREVVLPGAEAAAVDGERDELVERAAQRLGAAAHRAGVRLGARLRHAVGPPGGGELLELEALAGVPLVDRVVDHDAVARLAQALRARPAGRVARRRRGRPVARPPLRVDLELAEEHRHARRRQQPLGRDALERRQHARELAPALPAQPAAHAARAVVDALEPRGVLGRDAVGPRRRADGLRDRRPGRRARRRIRDAQAAGGVLRRGGRGQGEQDEDGEERAHALPQHGRSPIVAATHALHPFPHRPAAPARARGRHGDQGSSRTPGLSTPAGSSSRLAARSAAANGSGRWRSYQGGGRGRRRGGG